MNKKKDQEGKGGGPLNKTTSDPTQINRGVELLLRKRRKKTVPKTFQVRFGNIRNCDVSLGWKSLDNC